MKEIKIGTMVTDGSAYGKVDSISTDVFENIFATIVCDEGNGILNKRIANIERLTVLDWN